MRKRHTIALIAQNEARRMRKDIVFCSLVEYCVLVGHSGVEPLLERYKHPVLTVELMARVSFHDLRPLFIKWAGFRLLLKRPRQVDFSNAQLRRMMRDMTSCMLRNMKRVMKLILLDLTMRVNPRGG